MFGMNDDVLYWLDREVKESGSAAGGILSDPKL